MVTLYNTAMTFEQQFFIRREPNFTKLLNYGFIKDGNVYLYESSLSNQEFKARIHIKENGELFGELIDTAFDEPYLVIYSDRPIGDFAAALKEEYSALLEDIAKNCFTSVPFISNQANRIAKLIKDELGVNPDYPFKGKQIGSYGVFRHQESQSWFGLLMNLKDNIAYPGFKQGDVINLRINPEKEEEVRKYPFVHTAYHMNKKSWITIPLDEEASDEIIMELLKDSYQLSAGKGKKTPNQAVNRWVIPANVKYYDIVADFKARSTIEWDQKKGIKLGDIVYIYVSAPYSSLLYKTQVTKTDIPYHKDGYEFLLKLKLLKEYPQGKYTLQKMGEYGLSYVRGPRHMPKALVEILDKDK